MDQSCSEAFPRWLDSLGSDVLSLSALIAADGAPDAARQYLCGALLYTFKSLDHIPEGVEDLGFLEVAFVLRVACCIAQLEAPAVREADSRGLVARLATDSDLIEQMLPNHYNRLDSFVRSLRHQSARGRSASDLAHDPAIRALFLTDLQAWTDAYQPPSLPRDDKDIVRIRSFFETRLSS